MDVLAEKKVKLAACGEEHMGCLVLHGWVPDDEAQHCMACKKSFTTIRRRVSNWTWLDQLGVYLRVVMSIKYHKAE